MKAHEKNVRSCILYHEFNMITTVCHEIIHILVYALVGYAKDGTPNATRNPRPWFK